MRAYATVASDSARDRDLRRLSRGLEKRSNVSNPDDPEAPDDLTTLDPAPLARAPTLDVNAPAARSGAHEDERADSGDTPWLLGGYRIVGKLGEGGMGIVYEAEQQHPRRLVALKVIRGGKFVDEQYIRMFQREIDTLARLKHPHIGAIYDAGRTEQGEHFFAMELVRGLQLDAYLGGRPGPLDADELRFRLRLFLSLCEAVHYAHQRGVIHRDLKPSNIVVPDLEAVDSALLLPAVKILDFGLARITEGDVERRPR